MRQAPGVAEAIWPASGGSYTVLGLLNNGLALIMSDVPTFVTFAGDGLWSGIPPTSNLNTDTPLLALGLNTFTTSTTLQQNSWYAQPGAVTSEAAFLGSGACGSLGTAGNVCTASDGTTQYQSPLTGRVYTFAYQGKGEAPVLAANLLHAIADGGWAAISAMFDGAYQCTYEGKAGNLLGVSPNGVLDVSCLSTLPMYLRCKSACPAGATQVGGKCPFGFQQCR